MTGHRRIALLAASAALAISSLGVATASAASPETDSWTNHYDGPALECPTFTAFGDWVIQHQLTVYRRALHERLDAATAELIVRYQASPSSALAAFATPHHVSGRGGGTR